MTDYCPVMLQNTMHLCWKKAIYNDQGFLMMPLDYQDMDDILKMNSIFLSHNLSHLVSC